MALSVCAACLLPLGARAQTGFVLEEGVVSYDPSIAAPRVHPEQAPALPAIHTMGSDRALVIRFDDLSGGRAGYYATLTPCDADWNPLGSPVEWHYDGMPNLLPSRERTRVDQRPNRTEIEFRVPGRDERFLKSGNYRVQVHDRQSGRAVLEAPILVTETEGVLQARAERLFASSRAPLDETRLFGEYVYPEYVEFPMSDLKLRVVPDRFWKSALEPTGLDFSREDRVRFDDGRDPAWTVPPSYLPLDLTRLDPSAGAILQTDPASIPVTVTLQEVDAAFAPEMTRPPGNRTGAPLESDDAQLLNVGFTFRMAGLDVRNPVVLGDFNGWDPRNAVRLRPASLSDRWTGEALIRQGRYAYRVGSLEGGRFIPLEPGGVGSMDARELIFLAYLTEPSTRTDRLLTFQIVRY